MSHVRQRPPVSSHRSILPDNWHTRGTAVSVADSASPQQRSDVERFQHRDALQYPFSTERPSATESLLEIAQQNRPSRDAKTDRLLLSYRFSKKLETRLSSFQYPPLSRSGQQTRNVTPNGEQHWYPYLLGKSLFTWLHALLFCQGVREKERPCT